MARTWVKTIRLIGDSREYFQWESDGYVIKKFDASRAPDHRKPYRASAVAITDPKWKWGSCGAIGMKFIPVGPWRRTLAEAKADVEAAGPNDSGFHYSAERDRRVQFGRELRARR
jgi:hypothetical protein